jgi:hypothetical protein
MKAGHLPILSVEPRAAPICPPAPVMRTFARIQFATAFATALLASELRGAPSAPPPREEAPRVTTFRTEAPPRVDPIFGDVAGLRAAVEEYRALATEMRREREILSAAINAALVELGALGLQTRGSGKGQGGGKARNRRCPAAVEGHYDKAREAGSRYLGHGRRLDARMRELRRADELGDTAGLTPDFRIGIRQARETYLELLRDLRELRAAFHDQLGAELIHAGCNRLGRSAAAATTGDAERADAADPAAWELGAHELGAPAVHGSSSGGGAAVTMAATVGAGDGLAAAGAAPAIWIEIDNTRCARSATLTLDGSSFGEVPGRKSTQVRTQAGPHELCVLPSDDKRTCGRPGTVRRAYLYEGWTLAVRCEP